MNFHNKYKKCTPWWRPITAEFKLLLEHQRFTPLFGYEYEDDKVKLTNDGIITVKPGFLWGASGPTWDTKSSREASCIHDAFYHLSDMGIFKGKDSRKVREVADETLYRICRENGMWKWRAKAWLRALDLFGGIAWESENDTDN